MIGCWGMRGDLIKSFELFDDLNISAEDMDDESKRAEIFLQIIGDREGIQHLPLAYLELW